MSVNICWCNSEVAYRSLRLCCANLTARAISDMAAGPNPESNPGLSDLRQKLTTSEIGSIHTRFEPRSVAQIGKIENLRSVRARFEPRSHKLEFCTTQRSQNKSRTDHTEKSFFSLPITKKPPKPSFFGRWWCNHFRLTC